MSSWRHNPTAEVLSSYGCSLEEWWRIRDFGMDMVRAGISRGRTPLMAFRHQRAHAARREVEWKLTLPQWWSVWQSSGHWERRGVGRGYQMCRFGDVGPYSPENVFIGEGVLNVAAPSKKNSFPTGVMLRPGGDELNSANPYTARCHVGGRQRYLGCFATIAEAEAAYHAALKLDQRAVDHVARNKVGA